jgi:hypothetical protein
LPRAYCRTPQASAASPPSNTFASRLDHYRFHPHHCQMHDPYLDPYPVAALRRQILAWMQGLAPIGL